MVYVVVLVRVLVNADAGRTDVYVVASAAHAARHTPDLRRVEVVLPLTRTVRAPGPPLAHPARAAVLADDNKFSEVGIHIFRSMSIDGSVHSCRQRSNSRPVLQPSRGERVARVPAAAVDATDDGTTESEGSHGTVSHCRPCWMVIGGRDSWS